MLDEGAAVEMVEGELLRKAPKSPRHRIAACTGRDAIAAALPPGWHAALEQPVTLSDSEPEPDIAVARGTYADYPDRHPGPGDIALIVEVADATLSRDRGAKARAYARAGIGVYWLVDLKADRVEVRSGPRGSEYQLLATYSRGAKLPLTLDGQRVADIPVESLLPPSA